MSKLLDFPDQMRIRHVRDALWRRSAGGASVMIGSGFSRNATMKTPGACKPPDWAGVAKSMRTKLSPNSKESSKGAEGVCPTDALATAQQYSDEFGRAELHRFLRDQIRDDDMEPGDLHRRLLALPWADIFTTNWDTLLERTCELTVMPTYEVVRVKDELPLATRPRIVKLHGSLPAQFPLIATEQDYSAYPSNFAPFVNTARQALMETVFLLLGFSGDDPNFLRWSEWVQKELGSSAPKIYLAGWLNFARDVEEHLEEMGVVPIDLARHPKQEEWRRQQLEHEFAMDWLLTTLELGQPYPSEEWPKALAQPGTSIRSHLEPVDRTVWIAPSVPAELSDEEECGGLGEANIDEVVSAWAYNRKLYPGWLALPEHLRRELQDPGIHDISGDLLDTTKEDRILQGMGDRSLVERLRIVHEIVWRREVRLEPLGAELAFVAKEILEGVVHNREALERRVLDRQAVCRIAMALVTHARFGFDQSQFDKAVRVATEFAQHDTNALHGLQYEKCLWNLYESDNASLIEALDGWRVDSGDPYWIVRKASVMFEVDHGSEAVVPLLQSAVGALRRSRGYSLEISVLSRESWVAYLARKLVERSWSDADGSDPHRMKARDLARFNCDPPREIQALINAVEWRGKREKGPGFELGEGVVRPGTLELTQEGVRIANSIRAQASYRLVRLAEVVGLPPLSDRWPRSKAMLAQAAEWLHRDGQTEFAMRLMLRVTTYEDDDLVRRLLSRPNLATVPETVVASIVGLCERIIDYYLQRGLHRRGSVGVVSPMERVRVAMEMLARLALRLKPACAAEVLRRGLEVYGNRMFYGNLLLRGAIRHLLSRSWEALPMPAKADLALELLSAPIVGVDGYSPNPYCFVDPGELIDGGGGEEAIPSRDEQNNKEWEAIVRFLVRALACSEEAGSRAMLRLVQVAMAGRLTPDEEAKVGRAIWAGDDREYEGLPGENTLRHWVYLRMPEPRTGMAEEWFREKWMSAVDLSGVDGETLDSMLFHMGDAKERSGRHELSFEFSEQDEDYVVGVLRKWAATPIHHSLIPVFDGERIETMQNGIRGAATLLMYVDVPEDVAEALYAKQRKLGASGVAAMPLLAGLVRSLECRESEIQTALRKGFSSGDPQLVSNSAVTMQFWLDFAGRGVVCRPPSDLIREIGVIIATRRVDALGAALWVAAWVFSDGEESDRNEVRQLVLEGLASLVEKLAYRRPFPEDVDVPLLRWRCIGLASAMHERGCDEKAVMDWLAAAQDDPLPEVWQKVSDILV